MKGLIASIYRYGENDSSNGGLSSKVDKVVIVGEGIPEIFEATEEMPAVIIEKRRFGFRETDYLSARPVELEGKHTMAGGTFIYSHDSRFPADYPIPLHDRVEY